MKRFFSLKNIGLAFLFFGLLTWIDPGTIAFAQANPTLQSFASILSHVIRMLTFFTLLFINFGGDLLGVEYITGDIPLGTITNLWIVIRNITNVIFVVILLFLVFSNMFSFGSNSNWTIKEKLPRVIIALIAINFSLLAFKVVIDGVNVGTNVILSIPQSVLANQDRDSIKKLLEQGVDEDGDHCHPPHDPSQPDPFPVGHTYAGLPNNPNCKEFYKRFNELLCPSGDYLYDDQCVVYLNPPTTILANSQAAHNLMLAFGVYLYRLEQLPALAAQIGSWSGVVTNVLFSGIMTLAFFVSLLAVFIVLIFRVVALWIFMVFSPLIIAAAIMGISKGGEGSKKFITYLLIPLKVAAAFSVTFIMISAMVGFTPPGSPVFVFLGPPLSGFGNGMTGILWQIATIGIFWKLAFWAVEGTEAKFIVDSIKGGAERLGTAVARYATIDRPVIPYVRRDGTTGRVGLSAFIAPPHGQQGILGQIASKLERQARGHNTEFFRELGFLEEAMDRNRESLERLRTQMRSANGPNAVGQATKTALQEVGIDDLGTEVGTQLKAAIKEKLDAGIVNLNAANQAILDNFGNAGVVITDTQLANLVNDLADRNIATNADFTQEGTNEGAGAGAPPPAPPAPYAHANTFANIPDLIADIQDPATGNTVQRQDLGKMARDAGVNIATLKSELASNNITIQASNDTNINVDASGGPAATKINSGDNITAANILDQIKTAERSVDYNNTEWEHIYEAIKGQTVAGEIIDPSKVGADRAPYIRNLFVTKGWIPA